MPEPFTKDEQWERMKKWLAESIAAVEKGDLERLPGTFGGENASVVIEAYQTCQEAMRFLESWDQFGLPR